MLIRVVGEHQYTLVFYSDFIIYFPPESKAVVSVIAANRRVLKKDTPLSTIFYVSALPLLALGSYRERQRLKETEIDKRNKTQNHFNSLTKFTSSLT